MQQKLRFRRKSYGWGRTPVTRQGWVSILIYLVGVYSCVGLLISPSYAVCKSSEIMVFLVILLWTLGLIALCYKTGEKPKRQWGNKSIKN